MEDRKSGIDMRSSHISEFAITRELWWPLAIHFEPERVLTMYHVPPRVISVLQLGEERESNKLTRRANLLRLNDDVASRYKRLPHVIGLNLVSFSH
jgi:hypothetical protein